MTDKKDDVVTVIRDDGKEFLIKRSLVAEHINRGNFRVKNKADEPTEEERKKAVGFDLRKVPAGDTIPEEKAKLEKKAKSGDAK